MKKFSNTWSFMQTRLHVICSLFLIIFSFMFFSCATNRDVRRNAYIDYKNEHYEKIEEYFEKENKDREQIDLLVDEAMVKAIRGEYKQSVEVFNEAYMKMQLLTGEMTTGDKILAGVASEESIKYSGPAYEYSLLDSMSAYDFIRLGDLESARAMMRRSLNNNKELFNELKAMQKEFESQSKASINSQSTLSALAEFESVGESIPMDELLSPSELVSDKLDLELSPFIFYLGSLLFANDNDMAMAHDWMWNVANKIRPSLVDSALNIPEGKGSVNVITLTDNILRRQEAVKFMPIFKDLFGIEMNFKLTWPFVPSSFNVVNNVYVSVIDPETKNVIASDKSSIVEDFDNAVRQDVALKAQGAYDRSLIRNITRKSATYVVGIAALTITMEELADSDVPMGFLLVQSQIIGLQVALEALNEGEHADTRQGAFFPSKARASGIILDPGKYDLYIEYVNKNGEVIKDELIPGVEVKEGIPSIVASDFINTGNITLYDLGEDND